MDHQWQNQLITDRDLYKIKEVLYSDFTERSMISINDSTLNPKLRVFKLFKQEFKPEPYLSQPHNLHHTLALVRFRISSHNLCIETGRYTRPYTPKENRICIYCKSNEVEDEMHFLLDCPLYIQERIKLLNVIIPLVPHYEDLTQQTKFITIMTLEILNKPINEYKPIKE